MRREVRLSPDVIVQTDERDGVAYLYALARLIEANFADAPDGQRSDGGVTDRQVLVARIRCSADALSAAIAPGEPVFSRGIRERMVELRRILAIDGWSRAKEKERVKTDVEGGSTSVL